MNDWQEIETAPDNELVLICTADCKLAVATKELYDGHDHQSHKTKKMWGWFAAFSRGYEGGCVTLNAKSWQPLPLPPKHLYERKLTADLLEKQVKELRGE